MSITPLLFQPYSQNRQKRGSDANRLQEISKELEDGDPILIKQKNLGLYELTT